MSQEDREELVYLCCGVGLFSFVGVLLRVLCANAFPVASIDAVLFKDFVINALGSFLMGILSRNKGGIPKVMYVSLTVGLCGCATSFSSWMYDVAHRLYFPPEPVHLWDGIAQYLLSIIVGALLPMSAWHYGAMITLWPPSTPSTQLKQIPALVPYGAIPSTGKAEREKGAGLGEEKEKEEEGEEEDATKIPGEKNSVEAATKLLPEKAPALAYRHVWRGMCVFFAAVYLGVVIAATAPGDRRDTSVSTKSPVFLVKCMIFAPFGALTRYFLARRNRPMPHIPFYTLAANAASTVLLLLINIFALHEERNVFITPASTALTFFVAMGIGFCGSLSTVSSLINEMQSLPTFSSLKYFLLTVVPLQALLLVTLAVYVNA